MANIPIKICQNLSKIIILCVLLFDVQIINIRFWGGFVLFNMHEFYFGKEFHKK